MARWILSLAVGIAGSGMAVLAHHSIAAVYDSSRKATVEGAVIRFQFINPHPILTIGVVDGGGRAQEWLLEMDNRSELAAVGMTAETLTPGDRVVVTGSLARAQANRIYISRLDRPADGFRYEQVGSRPRVRAPSRPRSG
jgi:hypothetical protein